MLYLNHIFFTKAILMIPLYTFFDGKRNKINPIFLGILKLLLAGLVFLVRYSVQFSCIDSENFLRGGPPSHQGWSNKFYHCNNPFFGNLSGGGE